MRHNDIQQMVPAELAIHNAMIAVEEMPADERLTSAVLLLMQAQRKVSDYVDSMSVVR